MSAKKIIIVDEEVWYMDPILDRLKFYGYEISYFYDFKLAIDEIVGNILSYDLAIIDMKLPSGNVEIPDKEKYTENGLYLIKMIRDRTHDLPIIAFTVLSDAKIRDKLKNFKVCRLLKGANGGELDRTINDKLYNKK